MEIDLDKRDDQTRATDAKIALVKQQLNELVGKIGTIEGGSGIHIRIVSADALTGEEASKETGFSSYANSKLVGSVKYVLATPEESKDLTKCTYFPRTFGPYPVVYAAE